MDVAKVPDLLEPAEVEELMQRYLDTTRDNMTEWMKNSLTSDKVSIVLLRLFYVRSDRFLICLTSHSRIIVPFRRIGSKNGNPNRTARVIITRPYPSSYFRWSKNTYSWVYFIAMIIGKSNNEWPSSSSLIWMIWISLQVADTISHELTARVFQLCLDQLKTLLDYYRAAIQVVMTARCSIFYGFS